ncbi:MAG: type VI secretion system tip protein VgrG, partial [Polaromonas sp.]|nr:type VI secretion system tip protein VgrG [Polaromonas sp.]
MFATPIRPTPAGLQPPVAAYLALPTCAPKTLLGQPALLQLELADGSHRPWHGHITQASLLVSDGGPARYRLTIEPWLSFLGQPQDAWVFQNQTVMQIVEGVFADYSGQGKLAPAWRWDVADELQYAQRSLCVQHQETDLAFIQRLLREEGLFYWWEHQTQEGDTLGQHTLVIADHNAAFRPNPQPRVRYTQAGLALKTDSLTRWRNTAAVHTARIQQASQDYRSNGATPALREQSQTGQNLPAGLGGLSLTDIPGLYAYEDSAQGQRLALRQMQALDAQRHQARASGTLRQAAPGSTLTLLDHPVHDGTNAARDEHVLLAVHHRARNNLRADHQAQVLSLLGAIAKDQIKGDVQAQPDNPNDTDEPVYSSTLKLQPAAAPVRMVAGTASQPSLPDVRLHPRPTIHGVQTAIVVGGAEPIHTDRDHRIKVQFHWQRGANSSHRLSPQQGENAPASPASGSWVRVSQAWAGANWGANFIPRVGQEVLIGFIQGDIDRPVVMGTVYNGQGQAAAQSNQQNAGAAKASGDAPAWFPGTQPSGKHPGHQHPQVLAGHKSQELATSSQGSGGYNQLVFDDSPGQGRIEVSSSSAQT